MSHSLKSCSFGVETISLHFNGPRCASSKACRFRWIIIIHVPYTSQYAKKEISIEVPVESTCCIKSMLKMRHQKWFTQKRHRDKSWLQWVKYFNRLSKFFGTSACKFHKNLLFCETIQWPLGGKYSALLLNLKVIAADYFTRKFLSTSIITQHCRWLSVDLPNFSTLRTVVEIINLPLTARWPCSTYFQVPFISWICNQINLKLEAC